MTRFSRSRRAVGLAVVGLLALGGAGGCAAEAAEPARPKTAAFDKSLHARLPADVRAAGVLRVAGGGSAYPPFVAFAKDGRTRIGIEPELLQALGTVLGVRFEIGGGEFTEHLQRVQRHEVDLAVDSLGDTAEREAYADFVSYVKAGSSLVVQRGNPQAVAGLEQLCGKAVGAEEGSVQHDLLRRTQQRCGSRPIALRAYDENAQAMVQLRAGQLAAVLLDYPVAVAASTDSKTGAHFQLVSDAQYEPLTIGIAVAKDRTQLRDVLQDGVNRLIESGVYGEILQRWGMRAAAVDRSTVNLERRERPRS